MIKIRRNLFCVWFWLGWSKLDVQILPIIEKDLSSSETVTLTVFAVTNHDATVCMLASNIKGCHNIDTIKDITLNEHNLIFELHTPGMISMTDRQVEHVNKNGMCIIFTTLNFQMVEKEKLLLKNQTLAFDKPMRHFILKRCKDLQIRVMDVKERHNKDVWKLDTGLKTEELNEKIEGSNKKVLTLRCLTCNYYTLKVLKLQFLCLF